jgi:hypothetical protein
MKRIVTTAVFLPQLVTFIATLLKEIFLDKFRVAQLVNNLCIIYGI